MANWDMEFNAKKCEVFHVTRERKPLIYPYTLHGQILESVPTAKYLGVTISNDLRWEPHVRTITKKASRTLGFLRRNLRVSSPRHKEIAYRALVRPQVEYASSVWDPHLQKDIHALEMVQRRAARFVTGRYRRTSSVSDMLEGLAWRSLQQRRRDQRLAMLFNIVNEQVAIPKDGFITPAPSSNTRAHHSLSLEVPFYRADYAKNSFFARTPRDWNSLPAPIAEAQPYASFKAAVSNLPPSF